MQQEETTEFIGVQVRNYASCVIQRAHREIASNTLWAQLAPDTVGQKLGQILQE